MEENPAGRLKTNIGNDGKYLLPPYERNHSTNGSAVTVTVCRVTPSGSSVDRDGADQVALPSNVLDKGIPPLTSDDSNIVIDMVSLIWGWISRNIDKECGVGRLVPKSDGESALRLHLDEAAGISEESGELW